MTSPSTPISTSSTCPPFLSSNMEITKETFKLVPMGRNSCIYELSGFGRKSLRRNIRVCYVNGINNTLLRARSTAIHISNCFGGINVYGVYNPTRGVIPDILNSVSLFCKKKTEVERNLHHLWNNFFDSVNSEGILLQICSSQGAILTRNALLSYDPVKRKRIMVLGLAPACYIDPNICYSVNNYQTFLDIVPKIDLVGLCKFFDTSSLTPSHHEEDSLMDHSPTSLSYITPIQQSALNLFKISGVIDDNWVEQEEFEGEFLKEGFTVMTNGDTGEPCVIKFTRQGKHAPIGPLVETSLTIKPDFKDLSCLENVDKWIDVVSRVSRIGMQSILAIQFVEGRVPLLLCSSFDALDLARYLILIFTKPHTYSRNSFRTFAVKSETSLSVLSTAASIGVLVSKISVEGSSAGFLLFGNISKAMFSCLSASIPQIEEAFERGGSSGYENEGDRDEIEGLLVNRDMEISHRTESLKNSIKELIGVGTSMIGYGCYLALSSGASSQITTNSTLNMTTIQDNSTDSSESASSSVFDVLNIIGTGAVAAVLLCSTVTKIVRVKKLLSKPHRRRRGNDL